MTDTPDQNVALVTGAGRGIGAALARRLAADGMHVVLTARTSSELEAVEEQIFEAGGQATIAPLDLTESDSIARLANAISERWNRLDLLALNAAMLGNLPRHRDRRQAVQQAAHPQHRGAAIAHRQF